MSVDCNSNQFPSTLSNCLNKIAEWMEYNKLHLNLDKTQLMIFRTRSPNTTVCNVMIDVDFADDIVKPSTVMKNLEIIFDNGLSLQSQVNNVVKKCFYHLRNISRIRHYIDSKTCETLVQCIIMSQIDYCDSI